MLLPTLEIKLKGISSGQCLRFLRYSKAGSEFAIDDDLSPNVGCKVKVFARHCPLAKCQAENLAVSDNAHKNQMDQYCYDAAGNRTGPTPCPASQYAYDAENRIKNAGGVNYTYDGDGKRVKKDSGKLYWTGTGGEPLAESDLAGNITSEFVFFNGKRIARLDLPSTVRYYFSDHLGSASVVTNADGTSIQDESDYFPFGGERILTNSDPNQYKFTGKERDAETGLDYFIARHYSSAIGRFLQPDEFTGGPVDVFGGEATPPGPLPYADITNPQSLNKYTYTIGSPLRYVDPNGHGEEDSDQPVNPLNNSSAGRAVNWLVGGDQVALAAYNTRNSETLLGKIGSGAALTLIVAVNVFTGGEGKGIEKGTEKLGSQLHHIASNKSIISGFTRQFESMFAKAGMSLQSAKNLMQLVGHAGRHSNGYHNLVLNELKTATSGLKAGSKEYREALVKALDRLRGRLLKDPDLIKR